MIKTIIFDVGGVILDFDMKSYYAYLAKKNGIRQGSIEKIIIPMMKEMDEGKIQLKEVEKKFGKALGIPGSRLEWVDGLIKLSKWNTNVLNLLKLLSRHYRIFLFSNDTKSRYKFLKRTMYDKLRKDGQIKRVFASCYIGIAKPKISSYKFVLKHSNSKPHETIFIDNSKPNVMAANDVGIHGILFTSYSELIKDLKKLGTQ